MRGILAVLVGLFFVVLVEGQTVVTEKTELHWTHSLKDKNGKDSDIVRFGIGILHLDKGSQTIENVDNVPVPPKSTGGVFKKKVSDIFRLNRRSGVFAIFIRAEHKDGRFGPWSNPEVLRWDDPVPDKVTDVFFKEPREEPSE